MADATGKKSSRNFLALRHMQGQLTAVHKPVKPAATAGEWSPGSLAMYKKEIVGVHNRLVFRPGENAWPTNRQGSRCYAVVLDYGCI